MAVPTPQEAPAHFKLETVDDIGRMLGGINDPETHLLARVAVRWYLEELLSLREQVALAYAQ